MIDNVKNFKQFMNEQVEINYDSYDKPLNFLLDHMDLENVDIFGEKYFNIERNTSLVTYLQTIRDLFEKLKPEEKFKIFSDFYGENNLTSILKRMTTKK